MNKAGTPEMYGAVGDGITDDYVAFKKAFISHSFIQLDAKTYVIRGRLGVPSYRTIQGAGKDKTIVKLMDNSPYGYSNNCVIFQNTFLTNTPVWYQYKNYDVNGNPVYDYEWVSGGPDGTILGSGSVNADSYAGDVIHYLVTDVFIKDEAPDSPLYHESQLDGNYQLVAKPFGGLGYLAYQYLGGLRKSIVMKDFTIDCNFNNQAKHSSYNWKGNYVHRVSTYIPELSWSVRPTIAAVSLAGEDLTLENIKVINYGYGVAGLNTGSYVKVGGNVTITQHKINYNDKKPAYTEGFILTLGNSLTTETLSGGYVDNTNSETNPPNSRLLKNKIINCEIGTPANVDLMNYASNYSAIVCNNMTSVGTDESAVTSLTSDADLYGCVINPGYYPQHVTASLWKDQNNNSKYLDDIANSTIKPTGVQYLFSWLTGSKGKQTGSNGQIAISNWPDGKRILKKISGSWFPNGDQSGLYKHRIQAATANRISYCTIRNCVFGYYHDTSKDDFTLQNNKFIDVQAGVYLNMGNLNNPTHKNVVIKNNYIKLAEHTRINNFGSINNFFGTSGGIVMQNSNVPYSIITYNSWKNNQTAKTFKNDNIIIENNIIEMPISSSKTLYEGGGSGVTEVKPFELYKTSIYSGINFTGDVSGSKYNFYRNFVIKNNRFINFNPPPTSSFSNVNYSIPISTLCFITASNDTVPPSKSRNFYRDKILRSYIIEDNTYSSPMYPFTSSLCKINFGIEVPNVGVYSYPINQLNKTDEVKVKGNLTVNGSVTAVSKSFLIDHPTKPNKKLQYSSLESPYHGVRLTGKSKTDKNGVKIDLPDYTFALVKKENINIQLTRFKSNKMFYVSNIDVDNNCFHVICDQCEEEHEFYWDFTAVRKDIDDLVTEF